MKLLGNTFASLQNRNYRLYFTGLAISQSGDWAQRIGQAWLVLELTGSGVLLGTTAALQALPTMLIGPWGGLLADRVDKRLFMLWTQGFQGLLALVLGVLTATGVVRVWMVFVMALLLGLVKTLDHPARKSIVFEMVGEHHLVNAIMLDSVLFNTAKVIGPGIAGWLISTVGLAASFYLNGATSLAVLTALLLIRASEMDPAPRAKRAPGQVREGLRHVVATPRLLGPLLLMTVTGIVAFEWAVTLPLLARNAFGGDAQVFGWMFSAMGAGAIVGGLAVAGALQPGTRTLLIVSLVFGSMMVVVSLSPTLPLVLLALAVLGASSTAFRASATALLQLRAAPHMRGRVMSLLGVALLGTTPVGAPLLGWMAEIVGIRAVFAIGGIVTALCSLASHAYVRRAGPARPQPEPAPMAERTAM